MIFGGIQEGDAIDSRLAGAQRGKLIFGKLAKCSQDTKCFFLFFLDYVDSGSHYLAFLISSTLFGIFMVIVVIVCCIR